MYCDFFGLRCRPFEDRPDAQFFCATSDAEEALATMEYESHYGKGTTLVLGEAGTGKTLLVRTLLQRLHATDHVGVLTWPSTGQTDVVQETCKSFGVTLPADQSQDRFLARLRRHLVRTHQADHRSILIIDQAENLSVEGIRQVAALTELQHDGEGLLNIILVGQPRLRAALDRPEFARVRQQLYGERTLLPLSAADTETYVEHRLRVAGAGTTDVFDKDAVALIHEAADGIPRLINHIASAAMVASLAADTIRRPPLY